MNTARPSAFCDSPEDLIVKTADWLDEVAENGTPVSAIQVLDKVRPVLEALRKERSDRSTTAGIIRDMSTETAVLLESRDTWKDTAQARLQQAAFLARPSVRAVLWILRLLTFGRVRA